MSSGRPRTAATFTAALVTALALAVPATSFGAAPAAPAAVAAPVAAVPPTIIGMRQFGRTVKGRPLRAYRLGDPSSTTKVVLIAVMHGDEPGPSKIIANLMQGAPVTGADVWVVPYLNRDGMARHTRKNARGVDLNRNYPTGWRRQSGKYNSGRRPASEPETRGLMRFLDNVDPDFVISMHQPLNGVDTSAGKARALATRLVHGLGLPPKVFSCNGGCHGTMTQWFNRNHAGAAITVEYGYRMTQRQIGVTGPDGLLGSVFAAR